MHVANRDAFFPGFSEKQFLLFFISEDPWQYLRNFRIPNDLVILSGLKGFKRKKEDVETLIISDKFSWLTVYNNDFLVCDELFKESIRDRETDIPIPYLKGSVKKREIEIIRDRLNYHPLYYSRLPDGFILSPRKEWIAKLGYKPISILNKNHIIVAQESIRLSNIKNMKHDYAVSKNKIGLLELFLDNIIHAYTELKRKTKRVYLVPSGSVGDLVLMNLLREDIELLWPFKQMEPPRFNTKYHYVDMDSILRNKEDIYSKLRDKAESSDNRLILPALIIDAFRKNNKSSTASVILTGLGLEFDDLNDLICTLNDLFKALWPTLLIPIALSGINIEIIKQGKITRRDITNYLNIEEDIILEYQSYFKSVKISRSYYE